MMQSPPLLFDRAALAQHRARTAAFGDKGDFLHVEIAEQVSERLQDINKTFNNGVVIGPKANLWANLLNISPNLPDFAALPDSETLDLQENSYDLLIHGLALHFANDPVGQLVQMRRALQPDGLMIAALFGGQTLHELRAAMAEAEVEIEGGLSPRISPMGEIRELGSLIQRAGLALPVADSVTLNVTYETPLHLMRDLRAMGETNVVNDRRKCFMRRKTLMRAVEIYSTNFALTDGRVPASFEVVFLTGWAPSENQQQPLRPGSAEARLADVLGTEEINAGEKT